jgi:hypothetical protein
MKPPGRITMRITPVTALIALLLATTLGLGYLYINTNSKLSDLKTISNNQNTRINELESTLSASREALEMVNITKASEAATKEPTYP